MANVLRYDTAVIDQIARQLKDLGNELTSCKGTVAGIASSMTRKSGSQLHYSSTSRLSMAGLRVGNDSIKSCLQQYANALSTYQSLVGKLSNQLYQLSQNIADTEHKLCNAIQKNGADSPFHGNNHGGGGKSFGDQSSAVTHEIIESLLSIIGAAGPLGALVSSVMGMGNNGFDLESILKFVVRGGDVAIKWATEGFDLVNMLDLAPYKGAADAAIKGFGSLANWLTSGITSAFNNWEEHGELSDRFFVEFFSETAADVALGTAATIAGGAILTAVGVAGAPALAAGAIGAVIYFGADCLWKYTIGNGDSIAESIGNTVGKGYEMAKEGVVWAGEKIAQGAEIIMEGASNVAEAALDGAQKVAQAAAEGLNNTAEAIWEGAAKFSNWFGETVRDGWNICAQWAS
ncbi:MAG: hypothetical protein E7324_00085 [Clostridiales bacterium]|nr:hypothetical protein [Clostridiales bacterium]